MEEPKSPPTNPSPSSPELGELRHTVSALSARVADLEERLALLQSARPILPAVDTITTRQLQAKPQLESRFGLTLVNRMGALTLAIGIIFFFKYASDNKWIGAEARVFIGLLAGFALIAAAEWMRRRQSPEAANMSDSSVFRQGIAGCGLAILYVSLYAAFGFYDLIVPVAGWAFLVAASALAVVLSLRYGSAAIAALGFIGALLTPTLLRNAATAWWFDFAYLLLLSATALGISLRQRWAVLIPALASLAVIAAALLFNSNHAIWFVCFAVLLGAMHFAGAAYAAKDRNLATYAYLTAHGCLLVGGMRLVALWAASDTSSAERFSFTSAIESVLLAIYGIVELVYGMLGRSVRNRAFGLVLLGLVITKLYVWDVWQLNRFYRVSAFVALGILLLTASYLYSRLRGRGSINP